MTNRYQIFLLFIISFFTSCITQDSGNDIKSMNTKTQGEMRLTQNISTTYPSLSKLKDDLMKDVKTILGENPNAIMARSDAINMGKGGYFGGGQFFGYTWQLKNSLVDQVNYIMEYDVRSYNDWIEKSISLYGKGKNLNENGILWYVPEMDGITVFIVNEGNRLILASAIMGYVDIP